jgi:hypothetical protein
MSLGYDLYVVPQEPTYRPTPEQLTQLMKFLIERLEIGGDWSVDGEDELDNASAVEHVRAAGASSHGGSESNVSFNDLVSGSIFGYEPDAPEPDQNYWADELRVCLTAAPFPFCDWEYEEASCPSCHQRFSQIAESLDEVRLTGSPVTCPCGTKTMPEDLKKSPGVQFAQLAIIFTGNRGWHYEVKSDREAFKDEDFLATIEQILGVKVDVLAVQH